MLITNIGIKKGSNQKEGMKRTLVKVSDGLMVTLLVWVTIIVDPKGSVTSLEEMGYGETMLDRQFVM